MEGLRKNILLQGKATVFNHAIVSTNIQIHRIILPKWWKDRNDKIKVLVSHLFINLHQAYV